MATTERPTPPRSRISTSMASASMKRRTNPRFHVGDYEGILMAVQQGSTKAKQLAAQLIPKFFKFFPGLASKAASAHFDLLEEEELGIRVQAIRGLPLLCKDTPDYVTKIVDVLGQLLVAEENVERDAVHKALMSLLRQDAKASLSGLFKHVESSDENIREKVIYFLKDKVFPLKAELLKPQEQMERHVTDLVKKFARCHWCRIQIVYGLPQQFEHFWESAPPDRIQELIEIIEGQADLDVQFNVSDIDHIDRLISCMFMAVPYFMRGASSSKFLSYYNKYVIPVFDKLPEERKQDLLKTLAGCSPYAMPQDSRQILPSIVQLLKKFMSRKKAGEGMNFSYVECLLYTFHHLAHKTPNSTNSLCGYKIVTGHRQTDSGRIFQKITKISPRDRLKYTEELVKGAIKKLTQGMAEHNKAMNAAKTEEDKAKIKTEKQNTTTGLRVCNNILAMTQPLHSKAPSFIGDEKITLSWKETPKPPPSKAAAAAGTLVGEKRTASATMGPRANQAPKKARSEGAAFKNQLVNRALEGLSSRGGRSSGRGRGWGGRGRGRSFR
ncbi:unnamed protein product [Spirodela intermedia]|uniref:Uncharacterized protein n=1 Tax=Spirodela intermedia TaxID=51605 RepID=A0A7I8JU25_SPIIN|nr:unnamed protein product [Spirodela intermedia]CAA6672952.1 unnamed protein product [Spirodela intermedia]